RPTTQHQRAGRPLRPQHVDAARAPDRPRLARGRGVAGAERPRPQVRLSQGGSRRRARPGASPPRAPCPSRQRARPGAPPFCAQQVAHHVRRTARTSPSAAWPPSWTRSSSTTPATGAVSGISIFIDSMISTVSPAPTSCPSDTTTFHTFPVTSARSSTTPLFSSGPPSCARQEGDDRRRVLERLLLDDPVRDAQPIPEPDQAVGHLLGRSQPDVGRVVPLA